MKCVLFFLTCVTIALAFPEGKLHPLSDEFIALINSKAKTWKAGRNFDSNVPLSSIKKLLGVLPKEQAPHRLPIKRMSKSLKDIPESFDAREAWPDCADIIGDIRDQANCGSCWAFGAVEAMSDRICIQSNATVKVSISAEDLLECCSSCGDGCSGGYPSEAWIYWRLTGITTGGKYGTSDGCKAYFLKPCDHHVDGQYGPCGDIQDAPQCHQTCDEGLDLDYTKEMQVGADAYGVNGKEKDIQIEIMTNGPVEADFEVYEDFLTYKSGVYEHTEGEYAGGHAIKLLGWGVEDGTPYWLAANSWNEGWGDQGYFKIKRGNSECRIEDDVIGGTPSF